MISVFDLYSRLHLFLYFTVSEEKDRFPGTFIVSRSVFEKSDFGKMMLVYGVFFDDVVWW